MSRVFVVQRPAYYDRDRRGWVNKFDLSPAKVHGELVFLLAPGNVYRERLDEAVLALRELLADFSVDDHILAVGDPVAIAASVMVASAATGGVVSILKYDKRRDAYDPYLVRVNEG
jgi:hypothetical protein